MVSVRSASRIRSRNASERFAYPRFSVSRSNSLSKSSSSDTPVLLNFDMTISFPIVTVLSGGIESPVYSHHHQSSGNDNILSGYGAACMPSSPEQDGPLP